MNTILRLSSTFRASVWRSRCECCWCSCNGKVAPTVNDSGAGSASAVVVMVQVAVHVAEKLLHFGAIPLTFSDSSGHIYEPEVSRERLRITFLFMFWPARHWRRRRSAGCTASHSSWHRRGCAHVLACSALEVRVFRRLRHIARGIVVGTISPNF